MKEVSSTSKAIIIRSDVEKKSDYHDYRESLRSDFWYSCAYCSITEAEAGGIGFEIDHYLPKNTNPGLINNYDNLFWSCGVCNRYKFDYDPDEKQISAGNVVIRSDEEDPREHLKLKEQILKEKTHTGEFNIELLELNRKQLRRLRSIREKFWEASNYIAFGVKELVSIRLDTIKPRRRYAFQALTKRILAQEGGLNRYLEQLIKNYARSPMLDLDPEKKERLKKRRKYLNEQKAISVEGLK
jgi:uncharacterized protein (TIGR02646 family)